LKGRTEHPASHFSNRCHHRGTHQSQVSEFSKVLGKSAVKLREF
jgi:hypothetical protein